MPQNNYPLHRKALVFVCGFLALIALLTSGCATMARGGAETLVVQSDPSGAEVKLSTGQAGLTPFSTPIKRKDGTIFVSVTKKGYKDLNTAVIPTIDGKSLGLGTAVNLLFLPIVNDIVDYNTKANYSHKPNPLIVTLIPADSDQSYNLVAPPGQPASQVPSNSKPEVANPEPTSRAISHDEALKGALNGDAVMQFIVGMDYAQGLNGVIVNQTAAVKWYRRSAEQGHAPAQSNLAYMYANGEGVPKDLVQAHVWWNIAGVQGLKEAKVSLAMVEKQMTAEQKAEAMKLAREQFAKLNRKNADALEQGGASTQTP